MALNYSISKPSLICISKYIFKHTKIFNYVCKYICSQILPSLDSPYTAVDVRKAGVTYIHIDTYSLAEFFASFE